MLMTVQTRRSIVIDDEMTHCWIASSDSDSNALRDALHRNVITSGEKYMNREAHLL